MEDPEGPRPVNRFTPPLIDRWSVGDLQAYIADLRAEISRAEAEIGKRQASKAAADLFFRKPGG